MSNPEKQAMTSSNHVDMKRLWKRIMDMAEIGATTGGGVNRAAFSEEDIAARKLLIKWANELSFCVTTDCIGNIYIRREGTNNHLAPIVTGSHLDSQPKGGKFDGAYGVLAGFEALESIERAGIKTKRPIEVVAWSNEEGGRFQPGAMGSAIFSGDYALSDALVAVDKGGSKLEDALEQTLASTPQITIREIPFPMAGYVETHIEQGPILEKHEKTIGVVKGVQGLCWYKVEVFGEEAHAGTAPLKTRKDAFKAATSIISALEELMDDETDTVRFTIGRFECAPGAPSTVPGYVLFTVDFRHPVLDIFNSLGDRIPKTCEKNGQGCEVKVERIIHSEPVTFDLSIINSVRDSANDLEISNMDIVSGAGHDAMHIASHCPAGMIFVPCEKGISHNEIENATPSDLAAGTRVLLSTLVNLANR